MIAIVFRRAADRLLVADPGLARFVTALRATLATLISAFICIEVAARFGSPPVVAGLAVLFCMIAPLFLRDHTLRGWLVSLSSLYLVAVSSFATAAALDAVPFVADAVFVALLFAGMLVQACGPRALGSALIGIVAFYFGVYLHPSSNEAALILALSMVAPCVIVCVARGIVPQRRIAAIQLAIRTVALRARDVLRETHRVGRTHTALSSMNEAAIAFEDRLALLDPDEAGALREALVELEVAAGQYVFDATSRPARESAFRSAIAKLEGIETTDSKRKNAPPPRKRIDMSQLRTSLSWLPALRTGAAALMAMLAGHVLSSERWFWAVITVFVVFLGTRSRGDTLYRAMQRIAGTLAGGLVSALLVTSLHDQPAAIAAAMLLCVFGWAYFIMSAYGPGVFFITVLVGLVYGGLGLAVQPLVELRIEEVAIGCLAALIAAFTVKPLDTTSHIEARFVGVVDALIEGVSAASANADENQGRAAAAVRALDRQWHDFRVALRPQRVFVWEPRYEQIAGALQCCVHNVRAMLSERSDTRQDAGSEHSFGSVMARLESVRARYARPIRNTLPIDTRTSDALVSLDGAVAMLASRIRDAQASRDISVTWRTLASLRARIGFH
ncbi:FUSC family protein [Caballeronia sp. HLA56]